jgi:hypothetical protein
MDSHFCTPNKQITCGYVVLLHVSVLGRHEWSDDDWRAFCQFGVDQSRERGWAVASLTYSSGRSPTAAQRRISATSVPKEGLAAQQRIAMLSDSAVMRMSMNAWRIFVRGTDLRAFRPIHYADAIAWVGEVAHTDSAAVLGALTELMIEAGYDAQVLQQDWRKASKS